MLIVVCKCAFQRLLIDLKVCQRAYNWFCQFIRSLFSNTGVMFADFIECGNLLNFNDSLNSVSRTGTNMSILFLTWTILPLTWTPGTPLTLIY